MLTAPHALTGRRPGVVSLLLSNLVPLVGVVWFGWSLWEVMCLYWLENAVIGVFAVGRILFADDGGKVSFGSHIGISAFFCVHYGGFWLVHGVFLAAMFGSGDLDVRAVGTGVTAMVVSHGVSFVFNYLSRERKWAVAGIEMFKPYGRVVLLHIVIMAGGFILQGGGSPVWGLVLLVVLKTTLDLTVHIIGHRWRDGDLPDVPPSRYDSVGWKRG